MYSCAIRSSSSVVTPGATALPASTSAPAAIRPATRIFSITSGVCAQGSVPSLAVGLPTYSGRAIHLGTDSVGDNTPGESAVRAGMTASLVTPARRRCGPWQRPEDKPGNQTQPGDDAGRGSGLRRSRAIKPSPATMRAVAAARGEAGPSNPARAPQKRAARSADDHRTAGHPTGHHDMRRSFARCALATVAGAAYIDFDVVDRGAGAVRQSDLE